MDLTLAFENLMDEEEIEGYEQQEKVSRRTDMTDHNIVRMVPRLKNVYPVAQLRI